VVTHSVADILRARMLAIACGYEDADDLDQLRTDPGFKLACGRLTDRFLAPDSVIQAHVLTNREQRVLLRVIQAELA
jgi:hypothetical protein